MGQIFSNTTDSLFAEYGIKCNENNKLFALLLKDGRYKDINKIVWNDFQTVDWTTNNIEIFNKIKFPKSVTKLCFYGDFNQKIDNIIIPTHITSLDICDRFNQSIENFRIPDHIESMMFETNCNNSLNKIIFPQNLKNLDLMLVNPYSIANIKLPENLEKFGFHNTEDIDKVIFPKSIREFFCLSGDLKFMETLDLKNIMVKIACPYEEMLYNLPSNIKKLHLIDVEIPIDNLPVEIEEVTIELNKELTSIEVLKQSKFPFECKIYLFCRSDDTYKHVVDKIKELEIPYNYNFIIGENNNKI